jgi:hypothetical protein
VLYCARILAKLYVGIFDGYRLLASILEVDSRERCTLCILR